MPRGILIDRTKNEITLDETEPLRGHLRQAIVNALKKTRFSKDGTLLAFGVESPLLKEEVAARLKLKGIFPDASFARELVKLSVEAFVEFLDEILDDDTKKAVHSTLVKDKQLPDKSFKLRLVFLILDGDSPHTPIKSSFPWKHL